MGIREKVFKKTNGKCVYCGSIADVTEYDYVLIDIVTE